MERQTGRQLLCGMLPNCGIGFGCAPSENTPRRKLADMLHPLALENDRFFHLAELVIEECRRRRIVVPAPRRLERLCVDLRFRARREMGDSWRMACRPTNGDGRMR